MSPSTSGVFSASPSAGCSSTSPGASPEQFPGSPTSSPATAFAIDDYLLTEEGTRQPSISPPAVAAGAAPGELEPDGEHSAGNLLIAKSFDGNKTISHLLAFC
jgi:hypothetical protein